MGDWNLGSVSTAVLVLVENVPTSISGTTLLEIADQKRQYCANYTGDSIGSNSIPLQFQSPITKLTAVDVMTSMQTLGADVDTIKLGDFSSKKGASSNIATSAIAMTEIAMNELNMIGQKTSFYKALG